MSAPCMFAGTWDRDEEHQAVAPSQLAGGTPGRQSLCFPSAAFLHCPGDCVFDFPCLSFLWAWLCCDIPLVAAVLDDKPRKGIA